MSLIRLAAACLAGVGLYRYAMRQRGRNAAFAAGEGSEENFSQVRNAGPEAMRDVPGQWSKIDEASDASFPASDPPSTY